MLWILAPILLLVTIISQTAELHTLWGIFAGAHPGWLLTALALQAVFALTQGAFYRAVFRLLEAEVPFAMSVWLSMVMAFASLASPAGTAAGVAYFVTAARGRGVPGPRAFGATLVYFFFDYGAGVVVVLAGVLILVFSRDLGLVQFLLVGLVIVVVLAPAFLVARAIAMPAVIPRVFAWAVDAIDRVGLRVRRRPFLGRERVAEWSHDLHEMVTTIRASPRRAIPPLLYAWGQQIITLATLAAVFRAVGAAPPFGVLVAGYAIGALSMVVSITPSGVGVTEGAMIVTFTSLGVPLETAVAGALLHRLFTFWLPMVAGFLALHAFPAPAAGSGSE